MRNNKYNVVFLQNNLEFCEFFIDSYPFLPGEDISFHLVTDDRNFPGFIFSLESLFILKSHPGLVLNKNVFLYEGSQMISKMEPTFGFTRQIEKDFYRKFILSLKLIPLLYLRHTYGIDKILYLDDDCTIMKDPRPIINANEYAMTTDVFCKLDGKDAELYREEYGKICEGELTLEEYNNQRMCAGITVLSYSPSLFTSIQNFFKSDFILNIWSSNTSTKKYNKAFFLEQYFYNFFFKINCKGRWARLKTGIAHYGSRALVDPEKRPKKFMKIKTFYHYGVGSVKSEWIKAFKSIPIADKEYLKTYDLPIYSKNE